MLNKEWFADWFNSKYYFLLYNKRNDDEAKTFINNLFSTFVINKNSKIWDNACGKGRHCKYISQLGHFTTGTDLAENSINEANSFNYNNTEFYVHDMRLPFRINYYDVVVNLFTSIGYFKKFNDNFSVFNSVNKALKPNGYFVVDFFNSNKVVNQLTKNNVEKRGDINFNITKEIDNNSIIKKIEFSAEEKQYYFEEKVNLLKLDDFLNFANTNGLKLIQKFGDYQLNDFDENKSDRLILIFKK